ncbi:MAG: hypothetical protein DIU69_01370 [Bacillota bacterium]|nr:MAG: hypothetical protein DIU69_01370 [Bacillota bacterium]
MDWLAVVVTVFRALISVAVIALGISWGIRGQMRVTLLVCAVLLVLGILWTNFAALLIPTLLLAYMAGVLTERGWFRRRA